MCHYPTSGGKGMQSILKKPDWFDSQKYTTPNSFPCCDVTADPLVCWHAEIQHSPHFQTPLLSIFWKWKSKKKKKVQTILFLLLDVQFTTPRQEKYCTEAGFLILINTWSQSLHPDFGWANSVLCKAKPSEEPQQLCHSAGDWRWQKPTRNCHSTTDGIRGMKGFASSLAKPGKILNALLFRDHSQAIAHYSNSHIQKVFMAFLFIT